MKFLRGLSWFSLLVACFCAWATVNNVQRGDWLWATITTACVLLNLRYALPPSSRWPKRLF